MSSGNAKSEPKGMSRAQAKPNSKQTDRAARPAPAQAGSRQARSAARPVSAVDPRYGKAAPNRFAGAPKTKGGPPAGDPDQLAIPMSKVNPLWIALAAVAVLAVVGTVVLVAGGSKSKASGTERPASTWVSREELEARQRHLEITRKSLDELPIAQETRPGEKAPPQQKPRIQASASGRPPAPGVVVARPAPAPAPAPPPKPKTSKAQKKQIDALDSIADDITSKLE